MTDMATNSAKPACLGDSRVTMAQTNEATTMASNAKVKRVQ